MKEMLKMQKMQGILTMLQTQTHELITQGLFYHNGQGPKRGGGGGPPRGVTIKLPDVESEVEIKLKRRLKNVGNFQLSSTRGLLAIVRAFSYRPWTSTTSSPAWGREPPRLNFV